MATNVEVPGLGESVTEAVLIKWHKSDGERVRENEPLAELETDKANVDVPAPTAGVLKRLKSEGETVHIGDAIASIDPSAQPSAAPQGAARQPEPATHAQSAPRSTPAQSEAPGRMPPTQTSPQSPARAPAIALEDYSPAVRRLLDEHKLDPSLIPTSGPGGRLTKEDILRYIDQRKGDDDDRAEDVDLAPAARVVDEPAPPSTQPAPGANGQGTKRVPMSKIAARSPSAWCRRSRRRPSSRRSTSSTSRASWSFARATRSSSKRRTAWGWAS